MGDQPFRILFVCVGNMCRSPLAERLLRIRLAQATPGEVFEVSSAGTNAGIGQPMEELAVNELVRLGGDPAGHAARRATADLLGAADLVLAATRDIRTGVISENPRIMRRAFTFVEFATLCHEADMRGEAIDSPAALVTWGSTHRTLAAREELDLPDPIGRGPDVHRATADRIDAAIQQIGTTLSRVVAAPAQPI